MMDGDALERHLLALDAVFPRANSLARIEELEKRTGGLIARSTLAKVLLVEAGLVKRSSAPLASITDRTMLDTRVVVKKVYEPRRSSTEPSVKLDVTDGTRSAKLEIRGDKVGLVDSRRVVPGSTLIIVNAEATLAGTTLELTAGDWSQVDVEPATPTAKRPSAISAGETGISLKGHVTAFSEPRSFIRPEGGTGFVCEVGLECEGESVTVTLWDGAAKVAQKLTIGERVALHGLYAKQRNGRLTLNSTRSTDVLFIDDAAHPSVGDGTMGAGVPSVTIGTPLLPAPAPDSASRSL